MKPHCYSAEVAVATATLDSINRRIRDISEMCTRPAGIYPRIRKHLKQHFQVTDLSAIHPSEYPSVMRYLISLEEVVFAAKVQAEQQHQNTVHLLISSIPLH